MRSRPITKYPRIVACLRGGLDTNLVPYLARHTFGTTAMRETGNTFAAMRQMGHASVLSMAPYQHQQTDQLTAVMNRRNTAGVGGDGAVQSR